MNKYIPTKLDRAEDQACNFNEDDFVVPSELARQLEDACNELAEALEEALEEMAYIEGELGANPIASKGRALLHKWKEANK